VGFILSDDITLAAGNAARELISGANLKSGQTVIVGCSTSEISGARIGTCSSAEIGLEVFNAIYTVFEENGIFLAAQCCEHLNRSIVIERKAACGCETVNVIPQTGAGGAFSFAAYNALRDPVVIESVRADAGLDIGGTLIGMHLKRVAIALRLETKYIGKAMVAAARTRPPLIGGVRAIYDDRLL